MWGKVMMREWLAGVAALTLLGVHPASAQAPRSLFDALPEPGRSTTFAPITPAPADPAASPEVPAVTPRRIAALPSAPLPPTRPLEADLSPVPTSAKTLKGSAAQQRTPKDESEPASIAAVPSAPQSSTDSSVSTSKPDKPMTRAERRKALKEARVAAASAANAPEASPATAAPYATNPLMTLFGALPAQERGEKLPAVVGRAQIDALVSHHARINHVPEALVHRIIVRESKYNPRAVGRGGAMGLMQIKTATARGVGYTGGPAGLLDAETNLTYGIKYLAGAWRVAGGSHDRAVSHYARGYYYEAKRRGVAGRRGRSAEPEASAAAASEPSGFFAAFARQASAQ